MKKVCGLVLGAGTSAQYIGLGFQPDEVILTNIYNGGTEAYGRLVWNRHMTRMSTTAEGFYTDQHDLDADVALKADGAGIIPYGGGDIVSTASANYVVPVSHPALVDTYGANHVDTGTLGRIRTWTASSGAAGYLNAGVNTTYVGVGSRVIIRPNGHNKGQDMEYACVAMSNDGDAASEFTLSDVPIAGEIVYISYKYDFANLPAGYVMPAGIKLNDTSLFNAASNKFILEAIKW